MRRLHRRAHHYGVLLGIAVMASLAMCASGATGVQDRDSDASSSTPATVRVPKVTWEGFMRNMTSAFGTVLQKIFPLLVRASSEVEVGPDCMASYFKLFLGLRKLKGWAVRSE